MPSAPADSDFILRYMLVIFANNNGEKKERSEQMIVSEVRNDGMTVRFHDEYYQKEPRLVLTEINQIISQAYRRRVSFCPPDQLVSIPMHTDRH